MGREDEREIKLKELTRNGKLDAKDCTSGEDMNLTVREISLDYSRGLMPVQKPNQLVHRRAERTLGERECIIGGKCMDKE